MYSSLQKIDLVAKGANGPIYIQTDHRTADEIEAEPEISTLFALVRVLRARAHATREGDTTPTIQYTVSDAAPPFLVEVLAATNATLGSFAEADRDGRVLEPVAATPAELADQAFAQLAKRVEARMGVTEPAVALKVLEAEALADPLDVEDDEIGYWTRVMELAAVTGEIVRKRGGGRWVDCDRGEIPFGFETPDLGILLPTNRASRFLDDGANESMFHLLDNLQEGPRDNLPILPSLRRRSEVAAEGMIFRSLLERAEDTDVPVIAYGTDSPTAFGLLVDTRTDDRDELHAKALANLAAQEVEIEEVELGGIDFVVVTNSFFATEKLLDVAFMNALHAKLGAPLLAVSVPRRGLMFVTDGAPEDAVRAMTILHTLTTKEYTTSRKISSALMLVTEGAVVGHVKLDGEAPPPQTAKKPGFFKRLFGRN